MSEVTIYTDGGCKPNPGAGGWGVVILREGKAPEEHFGGAEDSTNNRMELQAAIEALRALPPGTTATLVTDSTYVKSGITSWLPKWIAKNWTTSSKEPVKNRDLWEALSNELARHEVEWKWTKGHAGNRWNERADALATRGLRQIAGLPDIDPDENAAHLYLGIAFKAKESKGRVAVLLVYKDKEKSLTTDLEDVTSNELHIRSAIEALKALKRALPLQIYTASDYLKDGATRWIGSWRQRGWRTKEGKDVKNREAWEELDRLLQDFEVTWNVIGKKEDHELMQRVRALANG